MDISVTGMKAVLKIEGLCCANCATKIEDNVSKIPSVESARLSFITQKLTIEAPEDRMDAVIDEATRIAKKIEGGVSVCRIKRSHGCLREEIGPRRDGIRHRAALPLRPGR